MNKKIFGMVVGLMIIFVSSIAVGEQNKTIKKVIYTNQAPDAPIVLENECKMTNRGYKLIFCINDHEDDPVYYNIIWDNTMLACTPDKDWVGPFESGEEITIYHNWETSGKHTITILAKDNNNLISEETTYSVEFKKAKSFSNTFIYQLFEQFFKNLPIFGDIF